MLDDATEQHQCDECGRSKKARKIHVRTVETPNDQTTVDRVRGFIQDTVGESNTDTEGKTSSKPSEASKSSGDQEKTKIFYYCPHPPCEEHEDDIRKMERWRMKNAPDREFSEEALEETVEDIISEEKKYDRVKDDVVDDVYSRLVEDSEEDTTGEDTSTNDA